MSQNITIVTLKQSPTELYKILKFEGLVTSGAEAKLVIANELVKVNGEIEIRKRKKIIYGDVIEYHNHTLQITQVS